MIDLQSLVCGRLDDPSFTALINSGPDGEAAIYSEGLQPSPFPHAAKPMVIVEPSRHEEDDDTLDEEYRIESVGVRLYHKPDLDYLPLSTAAEWVRRRFKNWGPVSITGGELVNATVSGPDPGPTTDPTLAGRVLRINFLIKETA